MNSTRVTFSRRDPRPVRTRTALLTVVAVFLGGLAAPATPLALPDEPALGPGEPVPLLSAPVPARPIAAPASDRKSTRLNSSHLKLSRMPSSA